MGSLRQSVTDLLLVTVLLALATAVVLVFSGGQSVIRAAVVLPVLLFLPGYALVSALYPDRSSTDPEFRTKSNDGWSLNGVERVGLALAASLGIVPLVGLVLNFTHYGIRLVPVFVVVTGVTLLLTLVALIRRLQLDPERRFRFRLGSVLGGLPRRYLHPRNRASEQRFPFEAQTGSHRLLNLVLVASVLLLASSVAYAAVGPTLPSENGSFTELYLLSENQSGKLMAEDYPRNLSQGESAPLTVAVENHEGSDETYTVVVEAQRVAVGDGDRRVVEQTQLNRFQTHVENGERTTTETQITPALSANRQRIVVLLYRDDVPADPNSENAYRATHVWVSTGGGDSGGGSGDN